MSTKKTKPPLRDRFLAIIRRPSEHGQARHTRAAASEQALVSPAGTSQAPNDSRPMSNAASGSSEHDLNTPVVPVPQPEYESTARASQSIAVSPMRDALHLLAWSSVMSAFVKAKHESLPELPSLAGLLADFLGFTKQFKEVEDAKEHCANTAKQLDELMTVLKNLRARPALMSDNRSRLEATDEYIRTQQKLLSNLIAEMMGRALINRVALAKEVIMHVERIVTRVHTDVLLLHIKITDIARDLEIIEKTLRPVSLAGVFATQDRGCLAGTREAILASLVTWAKESSVPPVFWLSGMAGVGKTAIAQSFRDLLQADNIFTPSFFCSRRTLVNDYRNAMRIVPTFSALMAENYSEFRSALLKQLSTLKPGQDPFTLTLEQQFRLLLQIPLSKLEEPLPNTVLVIDALDELEDSSLMGEFLDSLLSAAEVLPVKFFLTSRPEDQVRFRFPNNRSSKLHSVLQLHDVEEDVVKADIRLYLSWKLKSIPRFHPNETDFHISESPWPTPSQLERLVQLANNLFLYASTVVKYLNAEDPEIRLQVLLNSQSTISTASLDDTYRFVLYIAFSNCEPQEGLNRKRCLGTLICACRPLSIPNMAELLNMDHSSVAAAFRPLHSVVQIPPCTADAISTFHASFQEYLTNTIRCGSEQWFINEPETHSDLALCCLRLMSGLRFNITRSKSSYLVNTEADQAAGVCVALSYSCQYGVKHLAHSQPQPADVVAYGECLCEKFMYWTEVLSVIGQVNQASHLLMELIDIISGQVNFPPKAIVDFLIDGNNFVIRFEQPISLSAPHVYISALPFTEPRSRIATAFQPLFARSLKVPDTVYIAQRQVPLLKLCGHTDWVHCVAFSPDCTRIVSGSGDRTIRVWEAMTGREVYEPLEGHTGRVYSVAFSPDSTRIVSGSKDMTIRVWDATTGREVCEPLEGHTGCVWSVAFSPDSTRIVSGSADKTIRVWDATTGREVCEPLEGHRSEVWSVAFSPDSTRIVSGSADKTIRVWDATTGKEVCDPLEGHTGVVLSVAFSPDSTRIVSGSRDKTIRVWDATTGREVCEPLEGHRSEVWSVAFSPDSTRIVSGSADKTIRVWDATTGKEVCDPLEGHTGVVLSVAFSPDSTRIVSGSRDKTIRVWDATTGREVCEPLEGHTGTVWSVVFSPDSTRIVSGSNDKTIRVWDATTGKEVCEPLEGHTDWVLSVAFSPDSTRIVSGSADRTIRVWDATTEAREASDRPLIDGSRPSTSFETAATEMVYHPPHFRLQQQAREQSYGWAVSSSGQRLFWVPEEFRRGLYTPRTMLVIGAKRCPVDVTQLVHGEEWTRCFVGPGTS